MSEKLEPGSRIGRRGRRWPALHVLVALALLLSTGFAHAAATEEQPAPTPPVAPVAPVAPEVSAVSVDCPPTIDGKLDDECWQLATHVVGFWRLEDGSPEYEPTEAWICYDQDAVYVAWYCHDSRPDEIVAQQKKRGGYLLGDDWVGIDLDVDFDHRNPYWFDVSAGGVQVESIPGGAAAKIEWRGDWRAAASRVEDGWQAEIALPLSIFRYPTGQPTFGFVLIRRLGREDDWSTWPCIGPGFELTRQAAWTDLDLPEPVGRPIFMPYALAEFGDAEDEGVTAGLDVKHQFPNGLQGMFSYNPDFRNIEDVVETIDFTYVERYLPEYRPFFLEGGGYHPYRRIFYSRRIPDFDLGLKLFGETGKHRIGALATSAFGEEQSVALAHQYNVTPLRSVSGALVHHTAPDEPDNLAYDLGAGGRFPKPDGEASYWLSWQGSVTEGPGGDGRHMGAGWNRDRQTGLSWNCGYEDTSLDFNPALGYVPEVGRHEAWLSFFHRSRYESGSVLERGWFGSTSRGAAQSGRRWNASLGGFIGRRDQRALYAEAGAGLYDGFDESTLVLNMDWRNRDIYRSGDITFVYGERLENPYRYASLSQATQIAEHISLRLRAEHVSASQLDENGRPTPPDSWQQYVLTTTYDITPEKTAAARMVAREEGTNWYLAYRQKVRRGTDAWVIIGDPNAETFTRRLAVKVVRVF
jgi:hypothetical protein